MFHQFQRNLGEVLDLPPDVLGDSPKITIFGRRQVVVENYRGIMFFSEEEVILETSDGELCLRGQGLALQAVLLTEIRISGELSSVAYQGGSKNA